jgi:competence protein ComEC
MATALGLCGLVVAVAAFVWRPCVLVIAGGAALLLGGCLLAASARITALDSELRAVLDHHAPGFSLATIEPPPPHEPIMMRAVLAEDASEGTETTVASAQVLSVRLQGAWRPAGGGVTLSVGGDRQRRGGSEWIAGRVIEAPATFRRPARFLDHGVADVERALAFDGTTLFASVKSGLLVETVARGSHVEEAAARIRAHVRRAVSRWVGRHDAVAAGIVTAVLIGDRSGLPDDVRLRLQQAGTYHVIAISGGNIAILAMLCVGFCRLARLPPRASAAAVVLTLLAHASIVAGGPSVWRATAMAVVYLAARILDLRTPPWQALGVAAILNVLVYPLDVRDAGFLLTCGATVALLEAARRTSHLLARRRLLRWVVGSLFASLAVEVALLPIQASLFSRITAAGLLLNLLAVPLMGIVQVTGMMVCVLAAADPVAAAMGSAAYWSTAGLVESARLVEWVPWLTRRIPPPGAAAVVAYYVSLGLLLALRERRRLAAAGAYCLSTWVIVAAPAPRTAAAGVLHLSLFDVGQAESIFLRLPDGGTMLVDTGGTPFGGTGFDVGGRVLAPALWALGVRRLDTLVLTHGDPDHLGGAQSVLDDFRPRAVWEGVDVPRHTALQELRVRAARLGAVATMRRAGESIPLGGVRVRILHPPEPDWERQRVRNDDSLVIEIVFGSVAILLTGDIGADVERTLAPRLTPAAVRILKVAHHGSRTSSSDALLEQWRPQIAIVSAGRGNTFGHPTVEVIRRLAAIGATVYRTDRDGQITLETDGISVRLRTFART